MPSATLSDELKLNKFIIRGVKKALALTRIKIGLAEDFGTESIGFEGKPLELVQFFSGKKVETLNYSKEHLKFLKNKLDLEDGQDIAKTVVQLMEIIEGVKQEFEPTEEPYWGYINGRKNMELEGVKMQKAAVLLFSRPVANSLNFYIGEDPPKETIPLGPTPSAVVFFLQYAFKSKIFSENKTLKNTASILGHKTVLMDAIHFSLGQLGAETIEENEDSNNE